jgi:transcriptional regulator with XRE-family HTH domain
MRYFGRELRRDREAVGASQRELSQGVLYSVSMVGAVERGEQLPTRAFCEKADDYFKTEGRYIRMREELLSQVVEPEWFRPWVEHERAATALWWYELSVIPGLLQTEAYARALLGDDEGKVATRLARQEILTRDEPPPPAMVTLIDERVLRHAVGDPGTMRNQLERLADAAQAFTLQVIPLDATTYRRLDGPFVVATVDGHDVVYLSTPARGFILDGPEVVSKMRRRFDLIRAEALSVRQSVTLIREVVGQWT